MDTQGLENFRNHLNSYAEKPPLKKQLEEAVSTASDLAQTMVDDEHIFQLEDEEVRMLKAYRSQKLKKPAGLFRWRYKFDNAEIVIPEAPSLIIDPQDESE